VSKIPLSCLHAGLAQYSGDPRIEWHLNAHSSKEAVIDAVKNLPYKGGNTLTGMLPNTTLSLLLINIVFHVCELTVHRLLAYGI